MGVSLPMPALRCPQCGSDKLWKDGIRKTNYGDVQRWLCRNCCYRFSDPTQNRSNKPEHVPKIQSTFLNSLATIASTSQICVTKPKGAKNLATVKPLKARLAGATKQDAKGKLVEFAWYLKREGYRDSSIRYWSKTLRQLVKLGADLFNPESVKDVIAKQKTWCETTKVNVAACYSVFAKANNIPFTLPRYTTTRKLPFIPTEKELDQLIAGCGKRTATFLQLLKETGMRSGEAWRLEWKDLDTEKRTLRLNNPEKRGNPRMFKLSGKLVSMLSALPKESQRIFPKSLKARRISFCMQRKKIAEKLKNPRINQITFHTFRHWKATMEYAKTKDILYVKQLLGHKRIEATLIYTQLVNFENDDYHVKVARTLEEACELVEAGFEYVTDMEDKKIFRKRK